MSNTKETIAVLYALGFALFAAGFVGVEEFGSADFVKTGFPRIAFSIGGYDSYQFIGVVTGVVCLPLSTSVLTTASSLLRTSSDVPSFVNFGISILSFVMAAIMFDRWKARNLLECGLFLCAFYGPNGKKDDTANGYFQCTFSCSA
jgi:hypothetical protein